MANEGIMSTPINTLSRDDLAVLLANNMMNNSVEFYTDCNKMETDSPVRKPYLQPVIKRLFHSPMSDGSPDSFVPHQDRVKKAKKRKQTLIPNSTEKIKKAYVKECDRDGYSPDLRDGMRKKVLISLFHNKEYSMDFS